MKRICSWCNKTLGYTNIEVRLKTITHGICTDCDKWIRKNWRQSMSDYLNSFDFPILLVDSDVVVKFANKSAMHFLEKDATEIVGYHGGDATECEYARMPEGCGKTIHCKACAIRNTVKETFKTGISFKDITAFQNIYSKSGLQKVQFKISTEKKNNQVLLKIDPVE